MWVPSRSLAISCASKPLCICNKLFFLLAAYGLQVSYGGTVERQEHSGGGCTPSYPCAVLSYAQVDFYRGLTSSTPGTLHYLGRKSSFLVPLMALLLGGLELIVIRLVQEPLFRVDVC